MDIFGLTVAFALVVLGTVTKNYWFSVLAALMAILVYPEAGTVFWMIASFLVGMIWQFAAKDFSHNSFFLVTVFLVGAIVSIVLGFVLLAVFFVVAMALFFLFGTTIRVSKKVSAKGREEWDDLKKSAEGAKGQYPHGKKELETIASTVGGKMGEAFNPNPRHKLASNKLGERISQGAKNLLDGLARIFK
jgi:hypothetical protein